MSRLRSARLAVALTAALFPIGQGLPFAFVFANEANGVAVVAHPIGYDGTGGTLTVTVGILASSDNASDMVTPTQNVVATWNALNATTGNLMFGIDNSVPPNSFDFESVLLHELGHSLGLAHPNLGFQDPEVTGSNTEYTQSTDGPDGSFDFGVGPDGIRGSADDVRGDDVNLNYFDRASNNPFALAATVDRTTYSRDVGDLPPGSAFSVNAARAVGAVTGFPNTEAVMQQGTRNDETQRTLSADDVAGIRYAATGLDETAGTADDYTLVIEYVGLVNAQADADITVQFDDSETAFAVSRSSGRFLATDHVAITSNNIFFNDGSAWFYNTTILPVALVDFAAAPLEDGGVAVSWATAAEYDHAYFEVHRSRDLTTWQSLGRVDDPEAIDRASLRRYGYHDANAEAGGYYYRLRAVATDGSHEDADAVYVDLGVATFGVVLSGNPLSAASCAELHVESASAIDLSVVDVGGRVVTWWTQVAGAGVTAIELDRLLGLPAGTYYLQAETRGERVVVPFVR